MKDQDVKYLIPASVVRALREYLAGRPWSEVHQAMPILESLELYKPQCKHEENPSADNENDA